MSREQSRALDSSVAGVPLEDLNADSARTLLEKLEISCAELDESFLEEVASIAKK